MDKCNEYYIHCGMTQKILQTIHIELLTHTHTLTECETI